MTEHFELYKKERDRVRALHAYKVGNEVLRKSLLFIADQHLNNHARVMRGGKPKKIETSAHKGLNFYYEDVIANKAK